MRLTSLTVAAGLALASASFAETVAPGNVEFDEYGAVQASLTGVAGDPANGRSVIVSKKRGNCIACHSSEAWADEMFHGEVGPVLDGVGGYRTAAELRGILVNSKMTFEGTIMPAYYKVDGFNRPGDAYTGKAAKELSPLLTAQEIEDVVAFLSTLTE